MHGAPNTYEIPCVPGHTRTPTSTFPVSPRACWAGRTRTPPCATACRRRSGDVSGYDALQFRAAVNPAYDANYGTRTQGLTVVLADGSGHRVGVAAASVGDAALAYPSGSAGTSAT